jgi:polysaccharide deacetylase family protein (PEP-CTERM system associated)
MSFANLHNADPPFSRAISCRCSRIECQTPLLLIRLQESRDPRSRPLMKWKHSSELTSLDLLLLVILAKMKNALSIDLEDYYHVTAFAQEAGADDWQSKKSRIEESTDKLLQQFSDADCKATFFVLGWLVESKPALIRQIADLGHEIACHSHKHRLVYEMTPDEFREDTYRAKELLEEASGKAILGYRAPSFSIGEKSLWAFEILLELGFTFDSSIFPVRHPNYGMPAAPRFPFLVCTPRGTIVEFPMPTVALGRRRSPIGGGAYLRLLPYWYTRWGIGFINSQEERPVCVYLHPWELDTGQPRMRGSLTAHLRHYFGLRGTEAKLHKLLSDFEFGTLGSLIAECKGLQTALSVSV